jgi:hypothetical protein
MTEENCCSNGSSGCNFESNATLVEIVMQMVGSHNRDQHLSCPICLRDSTLVVAALLHVEAARIETPPPGNSADEDNVLPETFALTASCQLQTAITLGMTGSVKRIQ